MDGSNMDYRYLKAFVATAKLKSFTLASQELNIAQSAISRQIKLLEKELKKDLLFRSSKGVQLTPQGKELLASCLQFEDRLKEVLGHHQIRTIRIGVLQGILENWFHSIVEKYCLNFPHHLNISVDGSHDIKKLLMDGQLDMAFFTEDIQTETLSSLTLFQEKFLLISKSEIDLSNLQQYPWIAYNQNDSIFRLCKKISQKIIYVNSMNTIIDLVEKGLGIAVIPDHVYKGKLDRSLQTGKTPRPPHSPSELNKEKNPKNLFHYPVKLKGKSFIYLVMPNYKNPPSYLLDLVKLIKSSFDL